MAWTLDAADAGSGTSFASGTTLGVNPSQTIEVGKVLVAIVSKDNAGTTSNLLSAEARLSDSGGNRWIKAGEWRRTAGAANDGVVVGVFYSIITTQLTTGSTVTLTLSDARVAKTLQLAKGSIDAGKTVMVAGVRPAVGGSATPSSGALAVGAPVSSRAWIGVAAPEGPAADTFTQDGTFTNLGASGKIGTTNATAPANVSTVMGYRISASDTTETYNPGLGTSRDWAAMLVALDEVDPDPVLTEMLAKGATCVWPLGERAGDLFIDYAGQNPGQYLTLTGGTHGYNQAALKPELTWGAHRFQSASATTGVYGSVPDHADVDLGNGPLSLVFFGKFQSVPSQNGYWFRKASAYQVFYDGSTADEMSLNQPGVGPVRLGATVWSNTTARMWAGTKSGATSHIYWEGANDDGTQTNKTLVDSATALFLAADPVAAVFNDQHMQMAAIFKTELTSTDIEDIWLAATVAPSSESHSGAGVLVAGAAGLGTGAKGGSGVGAPISAASVAVGAGAKGGTSAAAPTAIAASGVGAGAKAGTGTAQVAVAPGASGVGTKGSVGAGAVNIAVVITADGDVGAEAFTGAGSVTLAVALTASGLAARTGVGVHASAVPASASGAAARAGSGSVTPASTMTGVGAKATAGAGAAPVALSLAGAGRKSVAATVIAAIASVLSAAGGISTAQVISLSSLTRTRRPLTRRRWGTLPFFD